MRRFLAEYGFVILIVIVIAGLVAVAIVVNSKNKTLVNENYSDFIDSTDPNIGGKDVDKELIENGQTVAPNSANNPKDTW